MKRLVEMVWEERRERVGNSSRSLCSGAGLELIGLLRRTTENTANTLCQVKDPRVYSNELFVSLQSKQFVQCLAVAISIISMVGLSCTYRTLYYSVLCTAIT